MSQLATIGTVAGVPAHLPRRSTVAPATTTDLLRKRLPRELVRDFRPHTGPVAREVMAAIAKRVPDYAEPMAGPLGSLLATSTQTVIGHAIDSFLVPNAPREDFTSLFRGIGESEHAAGRSLDAMRTAFTVAEEVIGQLIATYVRRWGASSDVARSCVVTVSASVRELAELATRGYLEAQARSPLPTDRCREELLTLLLADRAPDGDVVAAAARSARWNMPDVIAVVALRGPEPDASVPAIVNADPAMLVGVHDGQPVVIADRGKLGALAELPAGWRVAIGPNGSPARGGQALRTARRALDLADRGLLPSAAVIDCTEHITTLALFADDWLLDRMIEHGLAPLTGLTDRQRERMLVTLHEWLVTNGPAAQIADKLRIHPQTVRYRMKKLRELFGDRLVDPESRFELALVTRAVLLRHPPTEEHAELIA